MDLTLIFLIKKVIDLNFILAVLFASRETKFDLSTSQIKLNLN